VSDPGARATFWGCAAITVVAGVLRAVPAGGDLWLDEIWTWSLAQRLDGAWEIFEGIHHSNNNHLNTLVFYGFGDAAPGVLYRLPSLLAGIASVPLASLLAARRGRLEAVCAAILFGGCFALIHFSSEARGYAPAVFFALASLWLVDPRAPREIRPARLLAFHVCAVLGFLSHLVFLFFLAGPAAQLAWRTARGAPPRAAAIRRFVWLFAPPFFALAALWWLDLRHLHVGGGDATPLRWWLGRTVAFALGLPVLPALAFAWAALAAAVMTLGLRLSWRENDDDWVLVAVAVVLAPAAALGVLRPEVVAVRYFLIGIALYLLLASRVVAAGLRAGGWRRAVAVTGLALFLIGNALHVAPFLRLGRGGYSEAVRFMAGARGGAVFSVGSDHDFRTGLVLRYYARALPAGVRMVYQTESNRPRAGSDFLILHAGERPDPPGAALEDRFGNRYRLAREFDHAGISGFWWGVYRRAPSGDADASPR